MRVYFGLGTNLGDKEQNLRNAVQQIEKRIGRTVSLSAFFKTAPWGFASEHAFLNAVLCTDTTLTPGQILVLTQTIEREMGRTHKSTDGVYADRLIDIDLLMCDDLIVHTSTLQLPHPLMHLRRFVMQPLAEIAPDVVHPVLGKTMKDLLAQLLED